MVTTHNSQLTTHNGAGFGLLEVVLSAGILATVIGASVGLMNTSLRRATLASNRATAMNLAQESIELARTARDTTYLDGLSNDWTSAFSQTSTKEGSIAASGDSFALVYASRSDGTCCSWQTIKNAPTTSGSSGTIANGVETISLGGQDYRREVYVTLPAIDYPKMACLRSALDSTTPCDQVALDENSTIRKITVVVRWGSAPGEAVSSIEYLTNWRSG